MDISLYFTLNGQQLGPGTEIVLKNECYQRNKRFFCQKSRDLSPLVRFQHIVYNDSGSTTWVFKEGMVKDLAWNRDVETLVRPVPYVVKTDKDRIREKKEQGTTWDYIWFGTVVYILSMIFITVFNERVWGWIAATILYYNYRYERLSK